MNHHTSSSYDLILRGPQGHLICQVLYIIGSDDAAEDVPEEDQFKYIDALITLEAVNVNKTLVEYDVPYHVPSYIAIGERFLTQETIQSQEYNNSL